MAENLMNSAHKTGTLAYRQGWERIYGDRDCGTCRYEQEYRGDFPCVDCLETGMNDTDRWEPKGD